MIKVKFKISREMTDYSTISIGTICHSFEKKTSDTSYTKNKLKWIK